MIPHHISDVWRTCFFCQHYEPSPWSSAQVVCRQSGTRIVRASTDSCVFWRREPGADDDFPAVVREYLVAQGQDPDRVLAAKATPPRASFSGHRR